MKKPGLSNPFSWSHSRAEMYRECPRKYYLSYYGSWNGWSPKAPDRVRERYVQKNLTTRARWTGSLVHERAEIAFKRLKAGARVEPEQEIVEALAKARADVAASDAGLYRQSPKRYPGFEEHYYDAELPDGYWEDALARIARLLRVLFSSRIYRGLAGGKGAGKIVSVEDLAKLRVGDVDVWLVMDLALRTPSRGMIIVDWKTGRDHDPDAVRAQLGIYALYARRVWDVPPRRLSTIHADLNEGTERRHRLSEDALARTVEEIRESAFAMRARLADPERNFAREEDFPMTENLAKCATCRFRGDCGRA